MDTVDWIPGGQEPFPMVDLGTLYLQLGNSKTGEVSKLRRSVEAKRNPGASVETTSYSRAMISKDEKKLGPLLLTSDHSSGCDMPSSMLTRDPSQDKRSTFSQKVRGKGAKSASIWLYRFCSRGQAPIPKLEGRILISWC